MYVAAFVILLLLTVAIGGMSLFLTVLVFGHLIIGFEARDILRSELELENYILRAVVSARNLAECEHRYLQVWLPEAKLNHGGNTNKIARVEPEAVIGMFPAQGANL